MLGVKERPYLLKKSVGERNKLRHQNISEDKSKEILVKALYQRSEILQGTHEEKPDYYHLTAFVDNHSYLVLVDFTTTKEYNEIVHYHIMRQKEFMRLIRHTVEKEKHVLAGGRPVPPYTRYQRYQAQSGAKISDFR